MARTRMSATERRAQLLDVGRGVFAKRGYDATSVEEIARSAGVTKPIVYEHFGGKEGLYAVIVDHEIRELLGRMSVALEDGAPRDRTEAAADAFLKYIEERPDGFRVLLRDRPAIAPGEGTLASLIGDIADRVDQLLATELEDRGYSRQFAPLYARAIIGLIANVGQWWLETGSPDRPVVVAHIVNIAWNGIGGLRRNPPISDSRT